MLDLSPGDHVVNIRLVRDVRMMGGIGRPDLSIQLSAGFCPDTLVVDHRTCIFPETVNGRPAGSYIAIAMRNLSRHGARIDSVEYDYQQSNSETMNVGAL